MSNPLWNVGVAQQVPSLLATLKGFGVNTAGAANPNSPMDIASRLFAQQAPRTNTAAAIR